MSTRSVVYGRTDSGIKGVYVHSDGHPDTRLPVLAELIRRDGVDRVMSTLLEQTWGWSFLDSDPEGAPLPDSKQDGRFEPVPGYGVRYTAEDGGEPHYRDTSSEGRLDAVYVYVVEQDGSISYADNGGALWDGLDWKRTAR